MTRAVVIHDLRRDMRKEAEIVGDGIAAGVRRTTFGLRNSLRRQIRNSGLGERIPRLVSAALTETGTGGEVYTRTGGTAGGMRQQPFDLIEVFSQGATITPRRGRYLAIPTGFAPLQHGRGGGRRASPREMRDRGFKTWFVETGNGNGVIMAEIGGRTVATHVLVRRVTLRKRFDMEKPITRWTRRFPDIIVREMDKAAQKGL